MAKRRRVLLDPFQRITEVHWDAAILGVLEIHILPPPAAEDFRVEPDAASIPAIGINFADRSPASGPAVVHPPSKEMLNGTGDTNPPLLVWVTPLVSIPIPSPGSGNLLSVRWFFNLSKIEAEDSAGNANLVDADGNFTGTAEVNSPALGSGASVFFAVWRNPDIVDRIKYDERVTQNQRRKAKLLASGSGNFHFGFHSPGFTNAHIFWKYNVDSGAVEIVQRGTPS